MKTTKRLIPSLSVSCCACFAFIVWGYNVARAVQGDVDPQDDLVCLYHPIVGPLVAWSVFILSSAAKKFWIHGIDEWQNNARDLYIYCGILISVGFAILWQTQKADSPVRSPMFLIYLALTMNLAGYYWGVVLTETPTKVKPISESKH